MAKPRILCVDDDANLLEALLLSFQEMGLEASGARSGEEAVALLERVGADAVVLDLGLPGMDGIDACRALRALLPPDQWLPVLFLTGNADVATRVRVLDAGGDDFCAKPFLFEELAARIRVLLRRRARELVLRQETRRLLAYAYLDTLTELGNRRAFDSDLVREWARHERQGRPLALVLADVDHFKQVNDGFGHAAGDAILRAVGRSIAQSVRRSDLAFRFGGDEFAVLLPETDTAAAIAIAERVRHVVSVEAPRTAGPITLSVGVATTLEPAKADAAALLAAADRALYRAKAAGRDRIGTSRTSRPSPQGVS